MLTLSELSRLVGSDRATIERFTATQIDHSDRSCFNEGFSFLSADQIPKRFETVDTVSLEYLTILNYEVNTTYLHSKTGSLRSIIEFREKKSLYFCMCGRCKCANCWLPTATHIRRTLTKWITGHTLILSKMICLASMLSRQHQHYRIQFDEIKNQLNYFMDIVDYHMERYVLKNALDTVQLFFDARIALINRACTNRLLQLEFLQ
jgi:hypothetical protein